MRGQARADPLPRARHLGLVVLTQDVRGAHDRRAAAGVEGYLETAATERQACETGVVREQLTPLRDA